MVKVFPLPLIYTILLLRSFSRLRLKSSLSPLLPLKRETLLSLDEKLSANNSTQHSGTNISMVLRHMKHFLHCIRLQRESKQRSMCMENDMKWAGVSVCALGWMAKKHEKISVKEKEGKISQQNSTAQKKCSVLCHAIAKHTIALFSMTSS